MKRFFLCAVAIAALCSSCETEDEIFATETKNQTTTLHQAKGVETTNYQTYQSILKSFAYNNHQTYQENLLQFEEHVNQQMLNYVPQESYKYEKLNAEQLFMLQQADIDFIEQFTYTKETKKAIYAIINNSFNNEDLLLITNESELIIIENLFVLHSDGNGDDNKLNDNRSVAFAYGSQYSLTQAVLYAGAIELLAK